VHLHNLSTDTPLEISKYFYSNLLFEQCSMIYKLTNLVVIFRQTKSRFFDHYAVADLGYLKRARGLADLRERYQNNRRQNRLSDTFVPFHNFKPTWPQWGGWLATQWVIPFFIHTPPKDGRIPTPQSFGGTLWRKKSEGFIFWRRLWKKFPKGQFFGGSFDLKSDPPCAETCHP